MSNDLILPSYLDKSNHAGTYNPVNGPQQLNLVGNGGTPALPQPGNSAPAVPSKRPSIYDRNLNRRVPEVNIASLSFLFCEMVAWTHQNSKGIQQLEGKLNVLGYSIGAKLLELSYLRENQGSGSLRKTLKKDVKIIEILQFIHTVVWKNLFDKTADELEKSQDVDNEFMIIDNEPIISQFISVPKELKQLNTCAFVAGIIEGLLDAGYFQADVSAHNVPKEGFPLRTVYLVKFDKQVIEREFIRFG